MRADIPPDFPVSALLHRSSGCWPVRGLRCRRALRLPLRSNKHHAELHICQPARWWQNWWDDADPPASFSSLPDSAPGRADSNIHRPPEPNALLPSLSALHKGTVHPDSVKHVPFSRYRIIRSFLSFFHQSDNPNGKPGYPARSPYPADPSQKPGSAWSSARRTP